MNRISNNVNNLFDLYCELELKIDDEDSRITKIYPTSYADDEVIKILGNFVFPFRKIER